MYGVTVQIFFFFKKVIISSVDLMTFEHVISTLHIERRFGPYCTMSFLTTFNGSRFQIKDRKVLFIVSD